MFVLGKASLRDATYTSVDKKTFIQQQMFLAEENFFVSGWKKAETTKVGFVWQSVIYCFCLLWKEK